MTEFLNGVAVDAILLHGHGTSSSKRVTADDGWEETGGFEVEILYCGFDLRVDVTSHDVFGCCCLGPIVGGQVSACW